MPDAPRFRIGRLDHVHIRVPDRAEAGDGHPMVAQEAGVSFSVDAETFIAFARSLPGAIHAPEGRPLVADDVVDFDLCWAFNVADPWGNQYELNCYEYDRIRTELIEPDVIDPSRYWPRELFEEHTAAQTD